METERGNEQRNKERYERGKLACYARLDFLKNLSGKILIGFAALGFVVAFLLLLPAMISGGFTIGDWSTGDEIDRWYSGLSQPVAWAFDHAYLGFIIIGIGIPISVILYFSAKIAFNVQLRRLAKAYIWGLPLERKYIMAKFTDIVTLIYYQGRNVRHLLRKGKKLESKYVILRDGL